MCVNSANTIRLALLLLELFLRVLDYVDGHQASKVMIVVYVSSALMHATRQ